MTKQRMDNVMFSMFGVTAAEEEKVQKTAPKAEPVAQNNQSTASQAVTYIAPNSVMEGTLRTEGNIEIAGSFKGDIITKGHVVLRSNMEGNITAGSLHLLGCSLVGNITAASLVQLDSKATVNGNIAAGELSSSGNVKGNLDVKGNTLLDKGAVVEGDIVTQTLTVIQGAAITGGIKMNRA
ncbi:MAG: polymer-forming cytoskeletal protein [Oscillospiraceae bacterium]|nr:polymer-forming cytoskeletal protein [Oscillospiraceae bacterium]